MIVLNPLVDDPKKVISKIVDEDYIENPERRLKISFSHHSKYIIEKQIQKHFSCLEKSLMHHEIDLAIYKLGEIVKLKDLIKQDDINEKFEEVTLELFKSLNKDFDSFISRFNKKIDRDDLINSDDHDEYLKLLTNAQKMQKVIILLDARRANKYEELKENLSKQSNKLFENLKTKNIDTQSNLIKIYLDNLKIFMSISSNSIFQGPQQETMNNNEIANIYKKCRDDLEEKIKDMLAITKKNLLQTNDFDKIAKVLNRLQILGVQFQEHIRDATNYYGCIKDELINRFRQKSVECKPIFEQDLLTDSSINKIFETDFYFMTAIRCSLLHSHVSLEEIEDFYKEFMNLIIDYFKNIQEQVDNEVKIITSSLDTHANAMLDPIKNSFMKMKAVRENPQIEAKTNRVYQDSLEKLVYLIKKIKTEIEQQLNKILNQSENTRILYVNFVRNIKLLEKLKWVEEYKKNLYKYAHSDIGETLLYHIEDKQSLLLGVSLSLENYSKINNALDIVKKIVDIEPLIEIYPELKPIEKVKTWFQNELDKEFKKLISIYRQETNDFNIDYEFISLAICYLEWLGFRV